GARHPGVLLLPRELAGEQDAPLPLEELWRDAGREVVAAPPPERGRVAALREGLQRPQRARLLAAHGRDDEKVRVADARLAREERSEEFVVRGPADLVVD